MGVGAVNDPVLRGLILATVQYIAPSTLSDGVRRPASFSTGAYAGGSTFNVYTH